MSAATRKKAPRPPRSTWWCCNDLDRFHLVEDVIDRLPQLGARAAYLKQAMQERLIEHRLYIERYGDDIPEISGWKWGSAGESAAPATSTEGDNV